jgi:mannose-1-phosphate guanylyltransferase
MANAHHEHEKLTRIIKSLSLDIQVVVEGEIRGTAGGVAGARALFEPGPVLVWNGDILTQAPVKELVELARARDAQVLAVSPRALGEGTVGVDQEGSIVRLRGQRFGHEVRGGDYIGVSALGPSVVAALPERGCLFGDVALPHLHKGGRVWSVSSAAPWSDLGELAHYVAANFRWLDDALRHNPQPTTHNPQPTTHDPSSWIAPSAVVAPTVNVERCLIGAGARVGGAGRLSEIIAWPGASVSAPLSRAVVLTSGRVVPFGLPAEK